MDSSQRTRMKQEAANTYLSRTKTVDASMVTMRNQQRSAFAGAAVLNTPVYYRGAPVVDPINDLSSNNFFTNGYRNIPELSQHQDLANRRAGAALAGDADYSRSPPGIVLLSPSTASTILSTYNNNSFVPSVIENQEPVIRYIFPTNLASLYFNGNAFVQLSTDTVYSGGSDFTIEFFIKPSSATSPTTQTIFYIGTPASGVNQNLYKLIGNLIQTIPGKKFTFSLQVSTIGTISNGELLANEWYHISVMRFGNIIYLYINGSMLSYLQIPIAGIPASGPSITTYLTATDSESTATIGGAYDTGQSLSNGFIGNLTNFRWTKGRAVYTESLGVPYVTTILNPFQVTFPPLFIYSRQDAFTSLEPYVAVGLLTQSASTSLTNTKSPSSTVTVTDGRTISNTYTAITWEIV